MNEETIHRIIIKVLTSTASEKELNIFYFWLSSNNENKKFYFQIKDIFDSRNFKTLSDDKMIESSWKSLSRKISSKDSFLTTSFIIRKALSKYVSIAVAILLIIFSTIFLWTIHNNENQKWLIVSNPAGKIPKTITLSDGSLVKLNASSSIRYPEKFQKTREVYLAGEALFIVNHDVNKPFKVHSKQQEVTVLGTVFNINSYDANPFSETTLISGRVKLEIKNDKGKMQETILLSKNQKVKFDKKTLLSELSSINPQDVISWTNHKYVFKNTPLKEIIQRLSTIYNITIITSSNQSNQKYTCKFTIAQDIDSVLNILNFKNQFKFNRTNDSILITDR